MLTLPMFAAVRPARGPSDSWGSLQHLERMLDDMNQALSLVRDERSTTDVPLINVWSGAEGLVVTAEIPGVDPDSLNISVVDHTLTIRGTRQVTVAGQTERIELNRSVQLPYRIESDQTEARCQDGILTVALRRPDAERPKRIVVKAA